MPAKRQRCDDRGISVDRRDRRSGLLRRWCGFLRFAIAAAGRNDQYCRQPRAGGCRASREVLEKFIYQLHEDFELVVLHPVPSVFDFNMAEVMERTEIHL